MATQVKIFLVARISGNKSIFLFGQKFDFLRCHFQKRKILKGRDLFHIVISFLATMKQFLYLTLSWGGPFHIETSQFTLEFAKRVSPDFIKTIKLCFLFLYESLGMASLNCTFGKWLLSTIKKQKY